MMNAIYPKTSVPKKMVACGMVNHAKKKEAMMMNAKTFKRNRNVSKHQVVNGTLKIKCAQEDGCMWNGESCEEEGSEDNECKDIMFKDMCELEDGCTWNGKSCEEEGSEDDVCEDIT